MSQYFVVHLSDQRRELGTRELVAAHVDHLKRLRQEGFLQLRGPCEDGTALLVLRCADAAEAERLVEADPFAKAGYYRTRRIVRFTPADESNDFLLAGSTG